MNTLTHIKPQNSAMTRAIVQQAVKKKQEAIKAYNPTVKECQATANGVFTNKMYNTMPTALKKIYRDYNALMISATPKMETIMQHVKSLKLTPADFEREFTPAIWNQFSKAVQNRHMTGAHLDELERKEELKYIQVVFNAQQKVSVEISDDLYIEYEEIGESVAAFALDKVDSHILPDLTRNPKNLMKPSEIVQYLIAKSKGTIAHLYPNNIGKELGKMGFEQENGKYYINLVK
jgi:hypothetical protein